MPVRERAVDYVTEELIGTQVWDGLTGTCRTMPTADFEAVRDAVDVLFVRLVERVDWPRVLLEAQGRHLALDHDEPGDELFLIKGVCGECICEGLLALDRTHDWEDDEHAPRETTAMLPGHGGDDAVRAAAVKFAMALDR